MKKINKLSISPDKILKEDQLVSLKGGYAYCSCVTKYSVGGGGGDVVGHIYGVTDAYSCNSRCQQSYGSNVWGFIDTM